jgi:hypothetical protein
LKSFKSFNQIENKCPTVNLKKGYLYGYIRTIDLKRVLFDKKKNVFIKNDHIYNSNICIDYCFTHFEYRFAFFSNSTRDKKCLCVGGDGNEYISDQLDKKCEDDNDYYYVYDIGVQSKKQQKLYKQNQQTDSEIVKEYKMRMNSKNKLPRLVFLFLISDHTYERHFYRLFKKIYNRSNYYYIQVDSVCIY